MASTKDYLNFILDQLSLLDGWLARHMGTASDLVARLDSIADLFFTRW